MPDIVYVLTNEAMQGMVKIGRTTTSIGAHKTVLNLLDMHNEYPKLKLWELGQFLPLNKHLYVDYLKTGKPLDTASKKLMEATVSRYLKKARASMTNTSKGIFP